MLKLRSLDLFSGIGGITLALHDYAEPTLYCEIDPYAQAVLRSRMETNDLPRAPIHTDVRTLRGEPGQFDLICGGFPCQDISVAGFGKGLEGERSGLFFEICRLVGEIKPSFIFLENVPAIRTRGGERVGKELASLGYDCRWGVLSAFDVGAPHKRERWFLLAYRHSARLEVGQEERNQASQITATKSRFSGGVWPSVDSGFLRVAHGVPKRLDRIKCLGNSVVPAQVTEAFKRLSGVKHAHV